MSSRKYHLVYCKKHSVTLTFLKGRAEKIFPHSNISVATKTHLALFQNLLRLRFLFLQKRKSLLSYFIAEGFFSPVNGDKLRKKFEVQQFFNRPIHQTK